PSASCFPCPAPKRKPTGAAPPRALCTASAWCSPPRMRLEPSSAPCRSSSRSPRTNPIARIWRRCSCIAALAGEASAQRCSLRLVPKRGLEPPRGCPHQTLNLACLPIPPLRPTPERGAHLLEATRQVKAIAGILRECGGTGVRCTRGEVVDAKAAAARHRIL